MIREGLATQIANEPDMELCGEAEDVVEAVQRIVAAEPDLVIADISLKSGNGIDLVKRLIGKDPSLVILVWSMYPESLYAERALRAGGSRIRQQGAERFSNHGGRANRSGWPNVPRSGNRRETSATVRRACGHEITVRYVDNLADRELQAFELLGSGLTTQQIAVNMHVSPKTVETYRARIKEKLGLTNAVELVQHAVQWVIGKAEAT